MISASFPPQLCGKLWWFVLKPTSTLEIVCWHLHDWNHHKVLIYVKFKWYLRFYVIFGLTVSNSVFLIAEWPFNWFWPSLPAFADQMGQFAFCISRPKGTAPRKSQILPLSLSVATLTFNISRPKGDRSVNPRFFVHPDFSWQLPHLKSHFASAS